MPQTGQAAAPAPMGGTQHRAEQAEGQQVRDPQGWGQQGGSSGRRTRAVSFEAVSAPQERAGRLRTGGRGPIPAGNHGTFTERRGPALTAPGLREVPAEPPPRRREGPRSCPTTLHSQPPPYPAPCAACPPSMQRACQEPSSNAPERALVSTFTRPEHGPQQDTCIKQCTLLTAANTGQGGRSAPGAPGRAPQTGARVGVATAGGSGFRPWGCRPLRCESLS